MAAIVLIEEGVRHGLLGERPLSRYENAHAVVSLVVAQRESLVIDHGEAACPNFARNRTIGIRGIDGRQLLNVAHENEMLGAAHSNQTQKRVALRRLVHDHVVELECVAIRKALFERMDRACDEGVALEEVRCAHMRFPATAPIAGEHLVRQHGAIVFLYARAKTNGIRSILMAGNPFLACVLSAQARIGFDKTPLVRAGLIGMLSPAGDLFRDVIDGLTVVRHHGDVFAPANDA